MPAHANAAPAPTDAARLFIALWPGARLAAALHARYEAGRAGAPASPVPQERLHLTLHFLGQVPRARLPALRAALCVPCPRFELRFSRVERWAHGLVVAPPDHVPPPLIALHQALGDMLRGLGMRTEERAFHPHVTLARRHVGDWPAAPIDAAAAPLVWPVRAYALAESHAAGGAGYRLLKTCR